jgi:integrase/recombinase XerD
MTTNLTLDRQLDDYLAIRRSFGFRLERPEKLLRQFLAYLEAVGSDRVTVAGAVAWATLPEGGAPEWWGARLSVVRVFARHLHALDSRHEPIPADVLPVRSHRATPYLYSDEEVVALMAAARTLPRKLRATTMETIVGLLAVTGLRIGEAL